MRVVPAVDVVAGTRPFMRLAVAGVNARCARYRTQVRALAEATRRFVMKSRRA